MAELEKEVLTRKQWLKEEINDKRIERSRLINVKMSTKSETGDDFLLLQDNIDRLEHEIAELESDLNIETGKENVSLPPFVVNDANPVLSLAENIDWSISSLDIPRIHQEFGLTGKGIKIAVLDTGIYDHEDLNGAIIERLNTTSEPYPKKIEAYNAHGVGCASLIGARRNGTGILSVAPDCQIVAIKCLMESGSGTLVDITEAINLAIDRGVHIISMSLGGGSSIPALKNAIQRATAKGIYVVSAAGNSGGENTVGFPGKYSEGYAIAATNQQKKVSAFSSRGPEVDIAAPGERVLVAWKNNGYATVSGTSFACPITSGCFALFKQAGIKITPQLLKDNAIDIEEPGQDNKSGYGLIDPYKIIKQNYKKLEDEAPCLAPVAAVTAISATTARIDWPDATAFNYTVQVFNAGGDKLTDETIIREKFVILDKLKPNTKYSVSVRSNCSNGISPLTMVEFTTEQEVSPPNPPVGKPDDKVREAVRLLNEWLAL